MTRTSIRGKAGCGLRDAVGGAKVTGSAIFGTDPLGSACLVLARTGSTADFQLIQGAARLQPKSWGVWMALAYGEGMNASLVASAENVYQDASAPLPLRVAAATALEPFDAKAAAYALGQMQSFVAEFGGQDALVAALDALRASTPGRGEPGPAALQHARFANNLYMMSALLVLKSEVAHQLTSQCLTATNQVIRRLCGNVAARRWPDELLRAGQGLFTDYEYADLAAVIAVYWPEQAAAAAAAVPADKFAEARSKITASGIPFDDTGVLSYF